MRKLRSMCRRLFHTPWLAVIIMALVVAVVGLTLELAWMFEAREATALTCLGLGLVVGIILGWRGK